MIVWRDHNKYKIIIELYLWVVSYLNFVTSFFAVVKFPVTLTNLCTFCTLTHLANR
jgi:hypothetical protein